MLASSKYMHGHRGFISFCCCVVDEERVFKVPKNYLVSKRLPRLLLFFVLCVVREIKGYGAHACQALFFAWIWI
jgi:hypothetical protein